MFQLDGNISVSSCYSETDDFESPIEVIVGHCPDVKPQRKRMPIRKTLRRDNRGELSLYIYLTWQCTTIDLFGKN
jgi:hypothetical protein